jgi:hypothetical protein
MSPEIDLLNTYAVCGHEETDTRLYHVEIQRNWQGRDVEVQVYDIAPEVRVAMAVGRLALRLWQGHGPQSSSDPYLCLAAANPTVVPYT